MTWISVSEQLPDLDVPVWLACGDEVFIGGRTNCGDDGWFWANCYGSQYWDKTKWSAFDFDADDYAPTHWMPLPEPPNVQHEGRPEGVPLDAVVGRQTHGGNDGNLG